jgi:hypothetical protein
LTTTTALHHDAKLPHTTRLLTHTLITMENERGELVDRKPPRAVRVFQS